ncbi:MAG: hypothetical protein ACI841_005358 [Planctomycetota bacterium]|jgi:hypothetical protein
MFEWSCQSCAAKWTENQHTEGCDECGGGGMERACPMCKGKCGSVWKRAPMDSQDEGTAHWLGSCALRRPPAKA